jgi:hypothetical protein
MKCDSHVAVTIRKGVTLACSRATYRSDRLVISCFTNSSSNRLL